MKSFNIIEAVRFDMHMHGGKFIIWEFVLASFIVAGVVVASLFHYSLSNVTFLSGLWILSFIGIFFNCLVIAILAIKICRKEGNKPAFAENINPKRLAILFTIHILTPYLLSFTTCRQIEKI